MTVARQLEKEGEKIGKMKAKKEIAQKMLSTHYSIEEIARITKLSKKEISLLGK
jgi:hypothetical protein